LVYYHSASLGTEKGKRKGKTHISRKDAKIAKDPKKENIQHCKLNIELKPLKPLTDERLTSKAEH